MLEDKLLYALDNVLTTPIENLSRTGYLVPLIRNMGLVRGGNLWGDEDEPFLGDWGWENGLMQQPIQLANMLIYLKDKPIKKFVNIGTASGFTTSLITAYLLRFNVGLKVYTVDVYNFFKHFNAVLTKIPMGVITHVVGDYSFLYHMDLDLCFIDGNHGYEETRKNYEDIGRYATICVFHDVAEPNLKAECGRVWDEVKVMGKYTEIFDHPKNIKSMGIGILEL